MALISTDKIVDILGENRQKIKTIKDLYACVKKGLPKKSLQNVVSHILIKRSDQSVFKKSIIPEATYKRRKILTQDESEKVERLARVVATSEYVWDDIDDSQLYLNTPHPLLNGEKPIEVSKSEIGARMVEDLLWDLYYGHPA